LNKLLLLQQEKIILTEPADQLRICLTPAAEISILMVRTIRVSQAGFYLI